MHYSIEANEDMSTAIDWKIFRNMECQDDVNDICRIFVKNANTMVNYKELQSDNRRRNFAIFGSHTEENLAVEEKPEDGSYITILAMMSKLDPSESEPYYLPSVRLFSIFKKSRGITHDDDKTLNQLKSKLQENFTQKVAKMLPLYWFWTYFEKKAKLEQKEPENTDFDPRNILYRDFDMVDEFVKQSEKMSLLEDIDSIAPMAKQFKVLGPSTVSQFQDYVYEQKKGLCLDNEDPMSSPEADTNSPLPGNMEKIVQDLSLVKLVENVETRTKYLITMGHASHMLCIKTVGVDFCKMSNKFEQTSKNGAVSGNDDDSGSIWIRIINPCHYVESKEKDVNASEILLQKKMHVQNIANLGIYHMWIDVIKMNSSALNSKDHKKYSMN
jgi:hypothetical protein